MWKERRGYFILVHFVFSTNFTAIVKLQLWSSRTPEIMHKQHYKWKAMNVSDERGEKKNDEKKSERALFSSDVIHILFFSSYFKFFATIFLQLSFCILACNDEKTSCNGKTGKSLHETWEYGNTFWLSFPFCLDSLSHPHRSMLIEVKLSSKSLAFFAQWPFFSLSLSTFFSCKR